MGLDLCLQAIPEKCKILDLVSAGKIKVSLLGFINYHYEHEGHGKGELTLNSNNEWENNEGKYFIESLYDLEKTSPGVLDRSMYLGRAHPWFCRLLELQARTEEEEKIARNSVYGNDLLPAYLGEQEEPKLRWNSAEYSELISLWLSERSPAEIGNQYERAGFGRETVRLTDEEYEQQKKQVSQLFKEFQDLYKGAVENQEAIIVKLS
ncbi:hypothetical protein Pan153_24970 [Gimesia panareensis]|uniref:Uncharacterized protein n=1 Tax=Gimesia panareensis TaxID=2527978 RepID=A0A518FNC3_9PLAN|nr:hypothetical protein [Gimesia panareensis]QDV17841.1 hypothetical protein Pan153_24970 [Gimesia panareensis]